jgi:hypothetical protein
MKLPVPQVFLTSPTAKHTCPTLAACWSPTDLLKVGGYGVSIVTGFPSRARASSSGALRPQRRADVVNERRRVDSQMDLVSEFERSNHLP